MAPTTYSKDTSYSIGLGSLVQYDPIKADGKEQQNTSAKPGIADNGLNFI